MADTAFTPSDFVPLQPPPSQPATPIGGGGRQAIGSDFVPVAKAAPKGPAAKPPSATADVARGAVRGVVGAGMDLAALTVTPLYWLDRLLGGPETRTPLETSSDWLSKMVKPPQTTAGQGTELGTGLATGLLGGGAEAGVATRAGGKLLTKLPVVGRGLEAAARELPTHKVLGWATRAIQTSANERWNLSHLKSILSQAKAVELPKGMKAGQDAIAHVQKALGARYDELYGKLVGDLDAGARGKNAVALRGQPYRGSLREELTNLKQMADKGQMAMKDQLKSFIDQKVIGRFAASGKTAGSEVQKIAEDLRNEINLYARGTPEQRVYANALKQVQGHLRTMVQRVAGPVAGDLRKLDQAYAKLEVVSRAAIRDVAKEGIFTPKQALEAIRRRSPPKQFAAGKAPGQREMQKAAEGIRRKGVKDVVGPLAGAGGGAATEAFQRGGDQDDE